jgi:Ca2+-binding EF-hand superfamily protein
MKFTSPSSTSSASSLSSTSPPPRGCSNDNREEISTIFKLFDPTVSGYLDLSTFEVLAHSLGFRVTFVEICGMVEHFREEDKRRQRRTKRQRDEDDEGDINDDATDDNGDEGGLMIDLEMTIRILLQLGYAHRKNENVILMYYQLFDNNNKGFITLDDLRRIRDEVNVAEEEMQIMTSYFEGSDVGEGALSAMIDQFDDDHDGVIDYHEFRNTLGSLISSSR